MKTVWKFELAVTDEQAVRVPRGAQFLTVQMQGDRPCLWALVDPNAQPEDRIVRIHGTGHPVSESHLLQYISTFQLDGGALVFHAFEARA